LSHKTEDNGKRLQAREINFVSANHANLRESEKTLAKIRVIRG
jgi:hypothetical protein